MSKFEIVCWKSVIVRRQKYSQTLLLVNNWMIKGIQAYSSVATLVTQHIHAIAFLFRHCRVRYEGWALFPPWAILDAVTLHQIKDRKKYTQNHVIIYIWVNISIAHILGFFCRFESILFQFFFFFWTCSGWVLKDESEVGPTRNPPPSSLGRSVHYDGIFVLYNGISVHYEGIIRHHDGITMQYHNGGAAFNGFLECGSRFTLRLNIAKSTSYIEKCFRQK